MCQLQTQLSEKNRKGHKYCIEYNIRRLILNPYINMSFTAELSHLVVHNNIKKGHRAHELET